MNKAKLAAALHPWMVVETWHTGHPMDNKRFHKALHAACSSLGYSLTFDDFNDAMQLIAAKNHPELEPKYRDELIHEKAMQAEVIVSYLYDIANP